MLWLSRGNLLHCDCADTNFYHRQLLPLMAVTNDVIVNFGGHFLPLKHQKG